MVTVKDLKFSPQSHNGIGAILKTKSRLILSVQAGQGLYSTPRADGLDPESYSAFEVAIIDIKGDFVTDKFIDCGGDKVAGWVSRERINDLINFLDK